MSNQLQIFNHPEFGKVRVIEIDGEPYFVGRDVAIALGYSNSNDALTKHVPDKFKRVSQIATPGGEQAMTLISEAGMYKLVFKSKLPNAEKFSDWTCEEVLPSIRKTGVYATDTFLEKTLRDPDWAIGVLTQIKIEREKNAILAQQVAELQPKASYYDIVLQCKELVSVSKIAKDYGMSAIKFNRLLKELGIQFKQGDIWLLYQEYAQLGWTSTKTNLYDGKDGTKHSKIQTYWTQKGRLGLYDKLKNFGHLPIIERID